MRSSATRRFWKCFEGLPHPIRLEAKEAYGFFERDPYHPSLHFKRVPSIRPVFSVRISLEYRALGLVASGEITWFWIGSHGEYERLPKIRGQG